MEFMEKYGKSIKNVRNIGVEREYREDASAEMQEK